MSRTVLLLETIDPAALDLLRATVAVRTAASPAEADALAAAREGPVHAIITRGAGRVTAALLEACPEAMAVARCGVGLDNVDLEAATARGVVVLNLPGANAAQIWEPVPATVYTWGHG